MEMPYTMKSALFASWWVSEYATGGCIIFLVIWRMTSSISQRFGRCSCGFRDEVVIKRMLSEVSRNGR